MSGSFDLQTSRRAYTEKAKIWQNEVRKTLNEITTAKIPSIFYCKQVNAANISKDNMQDVFRFSNQTITISTLDKITINVDDIVKYRDTFYRVVSFQKKVIYNTTYYGGKPKYEIFIALLGD